MRKHFEEQLEELNVSLIKMGAMCETAIARSIKALLTQDLTLAKEVYEKDIQINQAEHQIEQQCFTLLLQQQPVARDLRVISAALKMITDLERIGDQAQDIAEIIMHAEHPLYNESVYLKEMALDAIKMVNDSLDSYVKHDLALAKKVIISDDKVDQLFVEVKKEQLETLKQSGNGADQALDILMIAKYLERIADHAVNIAEWAEFSVTGMHKSEGNI